MVIRARRRSAKRIDLTGREFVAIRFEGTTDAEFRLGTEFLRQNGACWNPHTRWWTVPAQTLQKLELILGDTAERRVYRMRKSS